MDSEVTAVRASVAKPAERTAIERLLNPSSIAIAGISAKPGSLGGMVLDNLERFGFAGDIHLIHPTQPALRGRPCVARPEDLPAGVDCVVLALPATAVLPALRGCAARGVGGAVIFAAGFAELGEAGAAQQREIAAIAAGGMVVEGPNCLGFVNEIDGVPLTFAVALPRRPAGQGIAIVSQSGAMASVLRAALHGRDLDVTMSVSTGNEAALSLEDVLAHLLGLPSTKMVALIAEHIRDPARFLRLARDAAAANIAIVLLHPGRSEAARRSAATHTGAMTGDHDIMRAHVARAGVMLVDTLEALVDLCDCLMRCPRGLVAGGRGVAVLGESGAFKAMALDYAAMLGLALPQPLGASSAALDAIAPGFIVASNPLDLTAQALADPTLYGRAMALLMDNPACGFLLVCLIVTSAETATRKMPSVIEAMRHWARGHVVLFAMLGEDTEIPPAIIAAVRQAGVVFLRSPERAMRALAHLGCRPAPMPLPEPGGVLPRLPPGPMAEHAAKDLLERAGIPMPPRAYVSDLAGAEAAAERIGFPVALKVQSPLLPHKSDVGGVVLHLADAAALAAGWHRLHAQLAQTAPHVVPDGVLVEKMAEAGVEMIVGGRRDPAWGVTMTVGRGGVEAEVTQDVRVFADGLSPAEIRADLRLLKAAALLGAFRGRPARDLDALCQVVVRLGQFLRAHPEVAEVEINPLVLLPHGSGAVALDALMTVER